MNEFENESFIRRNAIWLVVLAAIAGFGFLLFKGWDKVVNQEINGSMVTITGSFSCLPIKETMEEDGCVLGVKSNDGSFYGLDISRIQDANTDLKVEDTIAVTGIIKPESEVNSSEWETFDIVGVIQVNTLLRTR